jgi:hypothetical protein
VVHQVKTEPIPSTNANWPTLEEERELAWNKLGWFDPRFSRRWDIQADKQQQQQGTPAEKPSVTPQPAAAENKQAALAPETQQTAGNRGVHVMAQPTPTAPKLEQQKPELKPEQKPLVEKPNAQDAATPAKTAEPAQKAPEFKPVLPEHVTRSPNAAAPKRKFADLFKEDQRQASQGAKKVDQAASSAKAAEGQNKAIEEPSPAGKEQQKAAEASNVVVKAPEQAAAIAPKNGTDTPNNGTDAEKNGSNVPTNGTDAPKSVVAAALPAKEAPSQPSHTKFDDGVLWPSLEEEREQVANKAGWFDPRYSRRWDAVSIASIPDVLEAVLDFSEESNP